MLVGYVRVSISDDRQTNDLQRDALRSAGVDERNTHEDRALGERDDRPCLKAPLECLQSGDVLVVWKLDRLGRSLSHLIDIVTDLRGRGVGFRSMTESIDTTTAMGEFLFHEFGALVQYKRSLFRERMNARLAAVRCRGRRGGRPRKMDQEKIETAQGLLNSGISVSGAARLAGTSRSTSVDTLNRTGATCGRLS